MHLYVYFTVCFSSLLYLVLSRADDVFPDDDGSDAADFNSEDFFKSIRGAMDTLFEYMGDKNGCFFKCPNGAKPVKRPAHKPSSNGCGAFGIKLDTSYVPVIEDCCNRHDLCYDTCNRLKDSCDREFRDCLTVICKNVKKHVSRDIYDGCKSTADMMYAATMALGCKPYKDSQKEACICPRTHIDL